MKILVTGGAGFIGSKLAHALIEQGHQVDVLDNLSRGHEKNIPGESKFYKNNIGDPDVARILDNGYDVIFHQAAQGNLKKSITNTIGDINSDVAGSIHLFECAVKCGVKHIIFASTGGIYGEDNTLPSLETSSLKPVFPYGINKWFVERYLHYYHKMYGVKYTSLRYANVYGPGQNSFSEAGVIATFIEQMLQGKEITIYGSGEQTRDFIYVSDIVRSNILCMKKRYCGEINIGTSKETSINKIFASLAAASGYKQSPRYVDPLKGEVFRSALAIEKSEKELEWKPEVDIDDGLVKTYECFKNEFH